MVSVHPRMMMSPKRHHPSAVTGRSLVVAGVAAVAVLALAAVGPVSASPLSSSDRPRQPPRQPYYEREQAVLMPQRQEDLRQHWALGYMAEDAVRDDDDADHDADIAITFIRRPQTGLCEVVGLAPSRDRRLRRAPYPKAVISRRTPAAATPLHDHTHDEHNGRHHRGNLVHEAFHAAGMSPLLHEEFIEVIAISETEAWSLVTSTCRDVIRDGPAAAASLAAGNAIPKENVIEIIRSGPSRNRIDVVFIGDGYTASQRQDFIDDMRRLTDDMFTTTTFASTRPLFNVWAVFKPSAQSGIGVGGRARDTAFGLYRDGTELRGVYCSKPVVARMACKSTGPYACDFPSLIGNDDYYGGLGGEFTISTRSETSGTVVLRHELGHNFISVGEEYDGGQVYSGCNSARSLERIKWSHWLTDGPAKFVKEQKSTLRVQDYSWYDLAKGPYNITFKSDGKHAKWLLKISASGFEIPNSLSITLDDKPLPFESPLHLDRSFHEYSNLTSGFSAGKHVLSFSIPKLPALGKPIMQLCSVTLHEYGDDFVTDDGYIGAFPTISITGGKSYRPTNEGCLMRNMSRTEFCSVCMEGMFLEMFRKVSPIDAVMITALNATHQTASLSLLPLAQFRTPEPIDGESYEIAWIRDGEIIERFTDAIEIVISCREIRGGRSFDGDGEDDKVVGEEGSVGDWHVAVRFVSPQIRMDRDGLTVGKERVVWKKC